LDPSLAINQYAHTAWKVREGFSKGYIEAIAQTPDGYIWLGTEYGLFRFDGVRTVPWQPPTGEHLPNNDVASLLAARDGRLWIGTFNGLASWKDGKLTQYPQLTAHLVLNLLEDGEGTVWVGGMRVDSPNGTLCAIRSGSVHCYAEDGSVGVGPLWLYNDSRGNLWVKGANGVWRWKPGPPKFYALPGEPDSVTGIGEDTDGALLVGRNSGIYRLADETTGSFSELSASHEFRATKILRDRDDGLWIGTTGPLLHVHQGRTDRLGQSDGLSGNFVGSLFEDREGSIWAATLNGLDRFRDFAVPTLSVEQGLSSTTALSVLEARDGSVWIATEDGLNKWKNGQITIYRKRNAGSLSVAAQGAREITGTGLPDDRAEALGEDNGGRIWVSTQRGTAYFENGRFIPVPGVPGRHVFAIAGDDAGNVWISTENSGLLHVIHRNLVESIPWATLGHPEAACVLLRDPARGGLWLGFWHSGVAFFKDGHVRASFSSADGLGKGNIGSLKLDQDGTLWAATEAGLSRVKNGRVATLTSKNGLPCDAITWVENDADSFWLYASCGLIRISRQEMDRWVADPGRTIHVTVLGDSDGVRSHSAPRGYSPRVTRSSDGRLWFLPLDGVSVLDPSHLPINKVPPPVQVEQITSDRKIVWQNLSGDAPSHLRLPPRVRDVWINYTALSFVAPETVRFRYKLEGQDPDWKEVVNDRQAQYSNLAPGNYTFRVIASNNSGVWNETGASLDFSVAPAWYQTAWFRTFCIVALLALLWAIYRWRIRQLRSREKQLREVVETIPAMAWAALPDGKNSFANKHWIEYTGLAASDPSGPGWQNAIHPEDRERHLEKWRASIATGRLFEHEVRLRRAADGEYRWFWMRGVPQRNERGNILKWYGIATDIQDRKQAEAELHAMQEDLAHVNRVSMMGQLAASLAHEIKQPIAAAVSNAEACMLWLGRDQPDLAEAREAATETVKESNRAADIITRVRSLFQKEPTTHAVLDLNEAIIDTVPLLREEAHRHSISVRTDLDPELPRISADRVQLQQVFMNLMLNAIEAMKETGGGELAIKSQLDGDGQVLISVSDTGVGLPLDKTDQIFEPFFTTKLQGTGMGLVITRSIIEVHGGRLWATPNSGRGTTFRFTLPIQVTSRPGA
jgi:PAS domain S-box-containing protein